MSTATSRSSFAVDTLGDVHPAELGRLGLRVAPELSPFDGELALDELVLRGDGHVLTGRHAEGPADEAGQSGEADHAARHAAPREADDQRDVGHQPVAHAEHAGASNPTGDAPVLVVRRFGTGRGGGGWVHRSTG